MTNKKIKILSIFTLIVIFCIISLKAFSQELKPRLKLDMIVEKEVIKVKDGKEVVEREPVEKTKRGDIIIYTINYKNNGKAEAKNATITDPIPQGTTYVDNSADGKDTEIVFSIDGGKSYYKPPLKYKVKKTDGSEEEKVAPPEMYTNIRWLIKKILKPGKGGTVSFKVKVK